MEYSLNQEKQHWLNLFQSSARTLAKCSALLLGAVSELEHTNTFNPILLVEASTRAREVVERLVLLLEERLPEEM